MDAIQEDYLKRHFISMSYTISETFTLLKNGIITSNRPIEDWGKLLKDNAASSAILDRLLHRGHLLEFEGKSYRLKEAAKRLASGKKEM